MTQKRNTMTNKAYMNGVEKVRDSVWHNIDGNFRFDDIVMFLPLVPQRKVRIINAIKRFIVDNKLSSQFSIKGFFSFIKTNKDNLINFKGFGKGSYAHLDEAMNLTGLEERIG